MPILENKTCCALCIDMRSDNCGAEGCICHNPMQNTQNPTQEPTKEWEEEIRYALGEGKMEDIIVDADCWIKFISQLLASKDKECKDKLQHLENFYKKFAKKQLEIQKAEIIEKIKQMKKQPDCSENKNQECTPICGYNKALEDISETLKAD